MTGLTPRAVPPAADAGKISDIIRVYGIVRTTPGLPMPFTGPDRATFWFTSIVYAEDAREAVGTTRRVLGEAFGVAFGWHLDEMSNGPRRMYEAITPGGLVIMLAMRAEHADGLDETEDAGKLVAA